MDIPNEIKLGWRKYKIQHVKNLKDEEGQELYGQIDYNNKIIKLEESLTEDFKKVVFIHEVFHGIFNSMGRNDLKDDENLIDGLSERIYELLKDNIKE